MLRFVILTHDFPELHWDLMLEQGDVLRTWRLAKPPAVGVAIEAEPLPDHRRHYLDYEGAVSGGRGNVARFAAGHYVLELEKPGELLVRLHCDGLPPSVILRRDADEKWSVRFANS